MIPAHEALQQLQEGNRRFVLENCVRSSLVSAQRRSELVAGQAPFAIVLGCSDSRVPVEIVFDQSLGDLFVIRVAGNIADPTEIGSIEYAAQHLGTKLIVVLGHTRCGAVAATLDYLAAPTSDLSPNLSALVELIRPSVEPLSVGKHVHDQEALAREAVRANVRASVEKLTEKSALLANLVDNAGLQIVGAEYSLEEGVVDFFHGLPMMA